MRAWMSVVIAVLLAGAVRAPGQDRSADTQSLPPLPAREGSFSRAQLAAWEHYTRSVLRALFPARAKLVRKLDIVIERDDESTFAGTNVAGTLLITTGFIRFVRDEQEYAALLAHEFGHRLALHRSADRPPSSIADIFSTLNDGSFTFRDWLRYRENELEADFVSVMTSPRAAATLELLARVSAQHSHLGRTPGTSETEDQRQGERAKTLRLQAMQNILALPNLASLRTTLELPRCLPSRNARDEAWVACAYELLDALYPGYEYLREHTEVGFVELPEVPRAYAFWYENGENLIALNRDYVDAVVRKPEEFAALLGHEFGHIVLSRGFNADYENTGIEPPQSSYFREESEADLFGTLPIERGECHFATVLERSARYAPTGLRPDEDPEDHVRRNRLRAMCALNH